MVSMFRGFNDMGMDDLNLIHHQLQVNNPFEDLMLPSYGNNFHHLMGTNQTVHHHPVLERPSKQMKINSWNNNNNNNNSSANLLSFANSNQLTCLVTPKEEEAFLSVQNHHVAKKSSSHDHHQPDRLAQAKEHIMSERKRREKLSQRFIALSAMVPGLKKMDKASVLEDAIKYLKQLQDRVKTLEERRKVESTVLVKRSRVFVEDEDEDPFLGQETLCGSCSSDSFPGIEARFSDKDVLIRIHCEKKNGILEKLIAQIESLHLMVINSSALAFGSSALDVTIIVQMGYAFSMTAEDLVRHLHIALKHLI